MGCIDSSDLLEIATVKQLLIQSTMATISLVNVFGHRSILIENSTRRGMINSK